MGQGATLPFGRNGQLIGIFVNEKKGDIWLKETIMRFWA